MPYLKLFQETKISLPEVCLSAIFPGLQNPIANKSIKKLLLYNLFALICCAVAFLAEVSTATVGYSALQRAAARFKTGSQQYISSRDEPCVLRKIFSRNSS